MSRALPFVIVALSTVLIVSCVKKTPGNDVVVSVGSKKITRAQVMRVAEILRQEIVRVYPERAVEGVTGEVVKSASRQLVANEVMLSEARRRGIKVESSRIDSAFQKIVSRFGDQAAMQREMTRMGETEASIRQQLGEGVVLDSLMRVLLLDIDSVPESECRAFYETNKVRYVSTPRVRASQILIKIDSIATDEERKNALEKAEKVLAGLREGKKFDALARQYSSISLADGDLGWFKPGDLKPELENTLFALKVGDVSSILKTASGLHILKKTGFEQGKQMTYSEAREHVRMMLEMRNRNKLVTNYVDSLIGTAGVVYFDTAFTLNAEALPDPQGLR